MCDIEQAIERFEELIKLLNGYKTETNSGTLLDKNLQAYNLAIEVLKEKQARENPPIFDGLMTSWETPDICGNCSEHLAAEWSFCPECGQPLTEQK